MGNRDILRTVKRLGGKVTRSTWAAATGMDPQAAAKQLQKLRGDGVLTLQGSKRGSHYVVTPPSTPTV